MTSEEAIADIRDNIKPVVGGKALDMAIKALEQAQWIPVSERLPEEETDVLVCNANGGIEISRGSYSTELRNEFIWCTSGWKFGKVIAWMPLPEAYKIENEVEK